MDVSSGWTAQGLTPLAAEIDMTWSGQGIVGADEGLAVSWLGDAPRVEGRVFALASLPSDNGALPFSGGGKALVFSDGTLLLANAANRVYPAPFRTVFHGHHGSANVLERRLKALGDWPEEWSGGSRNGQLVPAYRPMRPIPSALEEDALITTLESLLAILGLAHTRAEWLSQPINRTGALSIPSARCFGGPPGAASTLKGALACLWAAGYPLPQLPGQSLRDGRRERTETGIEARCPPIATAHERVHIAARPSAQALRKALQPLLSTP